MFDGSRLAIERVLEAVLFASRWLLAPFYLGLALSIVVLLVKFLQELAHLDGVGVQRRQLAHVHAGAEPLDLHLEVREHLPDQHAQVDRDDDERGQAPEQAPPQLDQMLEQGLLGVVDVLHGSGRFSGGNSSAGATSGLAMGGIVSGSPGSG